MSKARRFFKKWLYPLAKMGKPYIKQWAQDKLIPKLQKKVNAGAKNVDKAIDTLIAEAVMEAIDKL